mgnify:CR=1 FL=1
MPEIRVSIFINASQKQVFDIARNIEIHELSVAQTNETAIAGKTSGLLGFGEQVTWRAKHFGIYQNLTSKITEYDSPNYFVDEMVDGAFKSFKHLHQFKKSEKGILMIDVFEYQSPFGVLGKFADWLFLEKYMTRFLHKRGVVIKEHAESL